MHWSWYHYHYPAWIPSVLLLFNKMKVRFLTAHPLVTWLRASPSTIHRPTEVTTAPGIQWREDRGPLHASQFPTRPCLTHQNCASSSLPVVNTYTKAHSPGCLWGGDWRWGTGWKGAQRNSLWCWKLLISWWGGISTDGGICQNSLNYVTMHAFYLTGL